MAVHESEGRQPGYERIAGKIREQIEDGTYPPGSLLPSRQEIIAEHGVSDTTARNVINRLTSEGLVTSRQGRGTFVRRRIKRSAIPARLYQLGEGPIPDESVLKVLALSVVEDVPPARIGMDLGLGPDTPAMIRTAILADRDGRQPSLMRTSYLPIDIARGTPVAAEAPLETDWLAILERITGRTVQSAAQFSRVRAVLPGEASRLNIPETTPVLVVHATTYDVQRRPIEHTRYLWPAEAVWQTDYYLTHP